MIMKTNPGPADSGTRPHLLKYAGLSLQASPFLIAQPCFEETPNTLWSTVHSHHRGRFIRTPDIDTDAVRLARPESVTGS